MPDRQLGAGPMRLHEQLFIVHKIVCVGYNR